MNPLLKWRKKYQSLPNEDITGDMCIDGMIDLSEALELDPSVARYDLDEPETILPSTFSRRNIATSDLSVENLEAIAQFGYGQIWSHCEGSGYNAAMLSKYGRVYATDCKDNSFPYRFYDVHDSVCEKEIAKIAKDGVLVYIWPLEFHDLDLWIKHSGKKVVVVGDFGPSHHLTHECMGAVFELCEERDISYHKYYLKIINAMDDSRMTDALRLLRKLCEENDIVYEDGFFDVYPVCPKFNIPGWELIKEMKVPQNTRYNDKAEFYRLSLLNSF